MKKIFSTLVEFFTLCTAISIACSFIELQVLFVALLFSLLTMVAYGFYQIAK